MFIPLLYAESIINTNSNKMFDHVIDDFEAETASSLAVLFTPVALAVTLANILSIAY
jgi:hypothetical protein